MFISLKNWIRPKDYDGTTCVETFLPRFECAAKYNGWNALSAHLKTCLVGAAEHLVWNAEEDTYEDMKQKLRYRFGAEEQQEKFRLELRYRRRKTTETLQELATGVEKLVQLAYPGGDTGLLDILARDGFIDALDDQKRQKEVHRQRPTSLRLALTEAIAWRSWSVAPEGVMNHHDHIRGEPSTQNKESLRHVRLNLGLQPSDKLDSARGGRSTVNARTGTLVVREVHRHRRNNQP